MLKPRYLPPEKINLSGVAEEDMSLFHFALLQLKASMVEQLADAEFLEALKQAESKRTHTVHQDVVASELELKAKQLLEVVGGSYEEDRKTKKESRRR